MTFKIDSNNHSALSLKNYYFIFVIKYRKKFLKNQKILLQPRKMAEYIEKSHNLNYL